MQYKLWEICICDTYSAPLAIMRSFFCDSISSCLHVLNITRWQAVYALTSSVNTQDAIMVAWGENWLSKMTDTKGMLTSAAKCTCPSFKQSIMKFALVIYWQMPRIILVHESQCEHSWILLSSTSIVIPTMQVLSMGVFSIPITRLLLISADVGIPSEVLRNFVPTSHLAESVDGQPKVWWAILAAERSPSFQIK